VLLRHPIARGEADERDLEVIQVNGRSRSGAGRVPEADEGRRQWARPEDGELRRRLSALQYAVTQRRGTEPPFENQYWDHHGDGLYVDVATGQPLFSSRDKYDSGTGWPSFTRPIGAEAVLERRDLSLLMPRTEVLSSGGRSHLGHVFRDGPAPTGRRYCMNSAALRFIAKEDLEHEGYGEYAQLFDDDQAERTG
jgi:peptide methionine sulfoxide reductase msrA/msrB